MNKKKFLAIILTIPLAIGLCSPVNANYISSVKRYDVIDAELQKIIEISKADDYIPVDIWFYENETTDDREASIKSIIGINKQTILDEKANVAENLVDKYITTEREIYAKKQNEFYEKRCFRMP